MPIAIVGLFALNWKRVISVGVNQTVPPGLVCSYIRSVVNGFYTWNARASNRLRSRIAVRKTRSAALCVGIPDSHRTGAIWSRQRTVTGTTRAPDDENRATEAAFLSNDKISSHSDDDREYQCCFHYTPRLFVYLKPFTIP